MDDGDRQSLRPIVSEHSSKWLLNGNRHYYDHELKLINRIFDNGL